METEWLHAQDLEQRRDVADAVDAADGRDSKLEQRLQSRSRFEWAPLTNADAQAGLIGKIH
jgi:hypothetical protein